MRNVLIALLAFATLLVTVLPTQAVPITRDQFDTVCGTHTGTGIDDPSTPYEYCTVKCGLNGEKTCLFKCTASGCEGTVLLATTEGDTPKPPKRFHDVMAMPGGSLSTSGESGGGGIVAPPVVVIY
jgi:hypothetical protein